MFDDSKWIAAEYNCTETGLSSEKDGSTLMRYAFNVNNDTKSVMLHICGLGLGVYQINGKPVSDEVLSTPVTSYEKRVLYSSYDISNLISRGKNVLAIHLGNGQYNHVGVPAAHHKKVIFEIVCTMEDDSVKWFASDTTAKSHRGPIVFNHAKSGEKYDARLELQGWTLPEYDDSDWDGTIICRGPGGLLVPNNCPPIRVVDTIPTKKIGENRYTTTQNISGWVRIKVKGKSGDKVVLKYGEQIDEDGKLNERINIFCPYELKHCDEYILKGEGVEEYEPSFVYHGFRYIDITTDAEIVEVDGRVVHNDVKRIASFECSSHMLNTIHKMCEWSTLTNLHYLPTDCPHREQAGWTADAMNVSEQALISFEMTELYKKWIGDIVDGQRNGGQISCIVPGAKYDWGTGVNWDSVLILLPYNIYNIYGDISIVRDTWDNMERLMDFFHSMSNNYIIGYGIGDWLPPPNTKACPTQALETAMYYMDAVVMAKLAKLLGKDSEKYSKLAENIKIAYLSKFDDDCEAEKSQTFLAAGIYTGIYGEKASAKAKKLAELVKNNGYHIDCGIIGSKFMFSALSDYGYTDVAYKMVTEPTMPSYAYWVNIGMTTLCENWNLVNSDDGFMASNNHPVHSEVIMLFYKYLAGFRFEGGTLAIRPCFIKDIEYVKAKYKDIFVYWDKSILKIDVPCKTLVCVNGKETYFEKGHHEIKLNGFTA